MSYNFTGVLSFLNRTSDLPDRRADRRQKAYLQYENDTQTFRLPLP